MNREICPICETATLVSNTYNGIIQHKGKELEVQNLEFSVCEICGSDPVLAAQAKRNQLRFADARRSADGLLSAQEIRSARKFLGLTQHEASRIFGGGLNAFSKYERGEVIQSEAMDKLIRVACQFPKAWRYMNQLAASGSTSPSELPGVELARHPAVSE